MVWAVTGLLISVVGVVGIVYFSVKLFAGMGQQQALAAQLRGLTFRDRRSMTRCFRRDQEVMGALKGAAPPLAQQLAGLRPLAGMTGAMTLTLVGLVVPPSSGLVGVVLHAFLWLVIVFAAVVAVLIARASSAGFRFLRSKGVSGRA